MSKRDISAEDFNMMTKHETTDDLEALLDGVPATRLDVSHVQRQVERMAEQVRQHDYEIFEVIGGDGPPYVPMKTSRINKALNEARVRLDPQMIRSLEPSGSRATVLALSVIAVLLSLTALAIALFG